MTRCGRKTRKNGQKTLVLCKLLHEDFLQNKATTTGAGGSSLTVQGSALFERFQGGKNERH
jgi:hypothetical protein